MGLIGGDSFSEFSDEDLQEELERRELERRLQEKPRQVENPDLTEVKATCQDFIDRLYMARIKIPVHGAMRKWEYIEEYGGNCVLNPISGYIEFPDGSSHYLVDLYRIIKFIKRFSPHEHSNGLQELRYQSNYSSTISYYGSNWILVGDIGYDLALLYGFILDAIQIAKENGFESKQLDIMERGIR